MKLIKYIGMGAVAVAALTSCSDFLDPDNKSTGNSNGEEFLIHNPTSLEATVYNSFSGFNLNVTLQEQGTDLFINPRGSNDGTFSLYEMTPADATVKSFYTDLYKAINYANAMIKYNGEDNKYGWEGKFFRAYGYYLLTQHFGGVPFVLNYIEDTGREYPRTPLQEIYDAEIAELETLYNNSGLEATNRNGIVSKQAVAALLTHYYLAYAWDFDTEIVNDELGTYAVKSTTRFDQAAQWAEKAINGVQLTMSFADKWSPFNEGNQEEIFSFQYLRDTKISRAHSLQNDYMGYYGNCQTTGQKGTGSGGTNAPSKKSLLLFEKGDQRWDGTFMSVYYNAPVENLGGINQAKWGTDGYFAYWNCTAEELSKKPIAFKFYPWYVTDAEAQADLQSLKSQTKKFAKDEYGINNPQAAVLREDEVPVWVFQTDGSLSKDFNTYDKFYTKAEGNAPCVKKFDDPSSSQVVKDADYRRVPLYHVSDMYLLAAEAYLLAGKTQQALDKINAVRGRAGLAPLASFEAYEPQYTVPSNFVYCPLDLVLDERARELYAERTRWMDLRRTKQLVRYNVAFARSIDTKADMCNFKGEVKWYRPIPEAEINTNLSMTLADQNPGY